MSCQAEMTFSDGKLLHFLGPTVCCFLTINLLTLACVAGGFYGWLTRKPGTRAKTSSEAAGIVAKPLVDAASPRLSLFSPHFTHSSTTRFSLAFPPTKTASYAGYLTPNIKEQILLSCHCTFLIKVLGRSC